MPEMDGLSATIEQRRREQSSGSHLKIVAMTAHAMEGDRQRCLDAGMDDYISKPIDPEQLKTVLEKHLPSTSLVVSKVVSKERAYVPTKALSVDVDLLVSRHKQHATMLFQVFLVDCPSLLDDLRDAFDARDVSEVLAKAHGLKGVCGSIAATRMQNLCAQIESQIKEMEWKLAEVSLQNLFVEFDQVKTFAPRIEYKNDYRFKTFNSMVSEEAVKVFIVDDQEVARLGLRVSLGEFPDLIIVGEARDGTEAIEIAQAVKPDVILMDIGLPGLDGIETTRQIKASNTSVRVLMLTSRDHENEVTASFSAGADGYCLKETAAEQIAAAIRAVSDGVVWMDPMIAKRALSVCPKADEISPPPSRSSKKDVKNSLTKREIEILDLVVKGLTNKQIAEKLVISLDTVKNHMRYVLAKLSVSDRTQAAVKALKDGLLEPSAQVGDSTLSE